MNRRDPTPAIAAAVAVVLLGLLAYGRTLTIPVWETDTWVLHLLSQRARAATSLSGALEPYAFILSNPKGWSDFFILGSWYALYRVWGASTVAFHVFGLACHLVAALLLGAYSVRRRMNRRAAFFASLVLLLIPLDHDVIAVEAQSQYPLFALLFLASLLLLEEWWARGSGARLVAGLALYLAALGTKELAFALPALLTLDALAERSAGRLSRDAARRSAIAVLASTALALPFLARPFWVALFSPSSATSPADAALLRDLWAFFRPTVLIPKTIGDLSRFLLVPFASEGDAARWFPLAAAVSLVVLGHGVLARLRTRVSLGWTGWRALLLVLLGYLPVGFHLARSSFEKTGELYLASLGWALLVGELLGGTAVPRHRARSVLAVIWLVAMAGHLQLLHRSMRSHGERVRAATLSLGELVSSSDRRDLVILGEPHLDRGAVDAVILGLTHERGALPVRVSLVNGTVGGVSTDTGGATCPADAVELGHAGERFVRWNDETHRFDELREGPQLRTAIAWRNPDTEDIHVRPVCLVSRNGLELFESETLLDLSAASILPRL